MSWYHQLSSDHLSTRHEGDWGAVEACHDTVCLMAGAFLYIDSWGKKHMVELDVEFFDEAGEPVGYPVWIRIWDPILGKMRSDAHWAGRENLAIATRSIGLGVSVTATGRRAQAQHAIHWDLSRRTHDYPCCQNWQISQLHNDLELRVIAYKVSLRY
jgi:hypothetical protein